MSRPMTFVTGVLLGSVLAAGLTLAAGATRARNEAQQSQSAADPNRAEGAPMTSTAWPSHAELKLAMGQALAELVPTLAQVVASQLGKDPANAAVTPAPAATPHDPAPEQLAAEDKVRREIERAVSSGHWSEDINHRVSLQAGLLTPEQRHNLAEALFDAVNAGKVSLGRNIPML